MDPIATYVFLDLGAIGLPQDTDPEIVSLSLLAVSSGDLRKINDDTRQDQIEQPPIICSRYHRDPGLHAETVIREFVDSVEKPVCLITYCAFYYDFPILKKVLSAKGIKYFEDMACADAMAGFYDILCPNGERTSRDDRLAGEYPWPKFGQPSFKLKDVYQRVLKDTEYYASGGDEYIDEVKFRNMAVVRIVVKLAEDFIPWLEKNCYKFGEVPLKPRPKFMLVPFKREEVKKEIE